MNSRYVAARDTSVLECYHERKGQRIEQYITMPSWKLDRGVLLSGRLFSMPHSALASLPILPVILDEATRVITIIWVLPWIKDTVEGWMQLVAILHRW